MQLITMALWQGKPNRKITGGRLITNRGKKKFEIGREKQFTKIGVQSLRQYRTTGGNTKVGMLSAEYANVVNKTANTVHKTKILTVKSNPSDPNYIQRNIINKGAVITTEDGDAVVTSRPGQDGAINAILYNN